MMKKMMILMLLVAVMGMCMQSCSKEETSIVNPTDNRIYDTELEVTKRDLVQYGLIMAEFDEKIHYFLFQNYKAAHVSHTKTAPDKVNYLIFNNWLLYKGKLSMTTEKDGQTVFAEFSISKMYKKQDANSYVLQVILKDEQGKYVFYASEDGSKRGMAQEWWNTITK